MQPSCGKGVAKSLISAVLACRQPSASELRRVHHQRLGQAEHLPQPEQRPTSFHKRRTRPEPEHSRLPAERSRSGPERHKPERRGHSKSEPGPEHSKTARQEHSSCDDA